MERTGRRRLAVLFSAIASGCAPSANGTLESLFCTPLPSGERVVHYQADTLGMDPSFAWELSPIDDGFLHGLVQANKLVAPPKGGSIPSTTYDWPSWWNTERIEALPERYYNDSNGLRRIWVDRENERIYIEFVGT